MGRPYEEELELVPRSFEFASNFPVDRFHEALRRCEGKPLIAVGSGGSYSAAELAAGLHGAYGGGVGFATTPLNLTAQLGVLRRAATIVFTASGSNSDVVGSTLKIVDSEPGHLIVVCGRIGSPLAEKLKRYECVDLIEFEAPGGKDGFLATNSLVIASALTLRSYERLAGIDRPWPQALDELLGMPFSLFLDDVERRSAPLWQRPHTIVLHGPSTKPGAVDVESKFSEAALSAIQLVDLRNFAHGRHVWLARRAMETGVVAIVCERDRKLLDQTLRLLPEGVPALHLELPDHGWRTGLASTVAAITLAGAAGRAAGVDPGRPGVPLFGRRLYNLRAFPRRDRNAQLHQNVAAALVRKTDTPIDRLAESGRLEGWLEAHDSFCSRLTSTLVSSVVLDFDGTLCAPRERYEGIRREVAGHLTRLVEAGVHVAVATGRGGSVREDLQGKLPEGVWSRVTMGYYNGGVIGPLSDSTLPQRGEPSGCLGEIASFLKADPSIADMAEIECRASQLSLSAKHGCVRDRLFTAVSHHVRRCEASALEVVVSSHSLDVLAPGVSKRRVLEAVAREGKHTLAIGDCGRWPGNDYSLLSHELSLSCLEASSDPNTCWNLAPPGCRGVHGTLWYLGKLHPARVKGAVRFRYTVRGTKS